MGVAVTCCPFNKNIQNDGQVIIDIQQGQTNDKFENIKTKTGPENNFSSKKKESIHFDKSNFIRMKEDNIFDEYDLKNKLGEGAYGCVYKVQQKTTNYLRAVKAIKKKHVDYEEFNNEIKY